MPVYSWNCDKCNVTTEVTNSIANIESAPEACVTGCADSIFTRVIVRPVGVKGFILEGSCWDFDGYRHSKPKSKPRRDG